MSARETSKCFQGLPKKWYQSKDNLQKCFRQYKNSGNNHNALVNHSLIPMSKHPNSTAPHTVELILMLKAQTNFAQLSLSSLLAAKYNIKLTEKTIYKYLKAFNNYSIL